MSKPKKSQIAAQNDLENVTNEVIEEAGGLIDKFFLQPIICVKKFLGLAVKGDVNFWQIVSLFFLFLIGSLSSQLVLLSTVVVWFVYERDRDPTLSAEARSIIVYKDMLVVEIISMGIGIFISLIIGYMYEIWSRKKVLTILFIMLAIGMILPATSALEDQRIYTWARIITSILAQSIMQNPLLNDYVKKHNRGFGASFQTLGKEVGEIIAFLLIYDGVHYDKEKQDIIYFSMTGVVLVFGILITCLMVKDKPVTREYIKDDQGNTIRKTKAVQRKEEGKQVKDADLGDSDSEEESEIAKFFDKPGAKFVKGVTVTILDKTKMLIKNTWNAIFGELMTQFVLFMTFVNALFSAKATTMMYLWTTKWIVSDEDSKVYDTDLTGDESWAIYQYFKVINFACAFFLIPLFGYFSDKFSLGYQLMVSFGLRTIATLAFFSFDSPNGDLVIFTLVMITLMNTLQGLAIDGFFAKRLPGDCRASLGGVKTLVNNLGHLSFVCFSLACVEYFDEIQGSVIFVSLFDASIFFIVAFIVGSNILEMDTHSGKQAREKGKNADQKVKHVKKKYDNMMQSMRVKGSAAQKGKETEMTEQQSLKLN